MATRRFEMREGTASKFWEVEPRGAALAIRWGKIGTVGQAQEKSFADEAAADREMGKLVAEKRKKGYVEITGAEVAGAEVTGAEVTGAASPADAPRAVDAPSPVHAPRVTPPAAPSADAPGFAIRKAFETGAVLTAPVMAGDRVAWADADQRSVVHVHALDGAPRWTAEIDGSPVAVHADDRWIVVRSALPDGDATRITWLDAATGAARGTVDLDPGSSSVLVGGVVVVLLAEEVFREVVPGQKQYVRRAPDAELVLLDGPGAAPRVVRAASGVFPLATAAGLVVENAFRADRVRARRVSGEVVWEHPGALVAADDGLVLVMHERALVGVDAARGVARWTQPDVFAKGMQPRGAVGHGLAVVAMRQTGQVRAFEAGNGLPRWSIVLPVPKRGVFPASTPLIGPRHVFLLDGGGRLTALDHADGSVAATMKERSDDGLDPGAMDARGERIALVHQGDTRTLMRLVAFGGAVAASATGAPKGDRPAAPALVSRSKRGARATTGGLDLAARMRAYVHLFARRTDVRIVESEIGDGVGAEALDPRVPADVRAFAERHGTLTLRWKHLDTPTHSELGGAFAFSARSLGSFDPAPWAEQREAPFSAFTTFDDVIAEGNGWLVLAEGAREAVVGFENANDGTFTPFPSFDAYVTAGARKAFTWYWPVGDGQGADLLDRLLEISVDPGTPPAELVTMLEARGATPDEARALVDWLGADVVVLLPA